MTITTKGTMSTKVSSLSLLELAMKKKVERESLAVTTTETSTSLESQVTPKSTSLESYAPAASLQPTSSSKSSPKPSSSSTSNSTEYNEALGTPSVGTPLPNIGTIKPSSQTSSKPSSLSLLELAMAKKVSTEIIEEAKSITKNEVKSTEHSEESSVAHKDTIEVTINLDSTDKVTTSNKALAYYLKHGVKLPTEQTVTEQGEEVGTPSTIVSSKTIETPKETPASQTPSNPLLALLSPKPIPKVEVPLPVVATPIPTVKEVPNKVEAKVSLIDLATKPTESIEAATSTDQLPTPSSTIVPTPTKTQTIGDLIRDVIVARGQVIQAEVKEIEVDEELPDTRTVTKLKETPSNYIGEDKLNSKQKQAVQYALDGKSYCLIGAAGSGKTTAIAEIIYKLSTIYAISDIAICAYTRKAANNVKVAMTKHPFLKDYLEGGAKFVSTIHRLLGFRPEEFDKFDAETGTVVKSRKFVPFYTEDNLLNKKLILIDEGSMVAVELFKQLYAANPTATYIFIGDINQLPPAFGDAILGYALCKLPVIELTEIYRQALDSPIVGFQHKFSLKGIAPSDSDLTNMNMLNRMEARLVDGLPPLRFVGYKPKVDIKDLTKEEGNKAISKELGGFLYQEFTKGNYRPLQDVILVPQNVGVGTWELNRQIANFIDFEEGRTVFEVIAAFTKLYFAVGDKVMFDKDDFVIEDIIPNPDYTGVEPKTPAVGLLRCGLNTNSPTEKNEMSFEDALEQVDFIANSETPDGDDERQVQISHEIKLRSLLDGQIKSISSLSELRKMELAYCLTVYKSQGSEWERVYFICLNKHARMLDRETLYTAMTRAKKNLVVLYSPETFKGGYNSTVAKCIATPSIKGVNLKEKLVQFTLKASEFIAKMETDPFEGMLEAHKWN